MVAWNAVAQKDNFFAWNHCFKTIGPQSSAIKIALLISSFICSIWYVEHEQIQMTWLHRGKKKWFFLFKQKSFLALRWMLNRKVAYKCRNKAYTTLSAIAVSTRAAKALASASALCEQHRQQQQQQQLKQQQQQQ